MVTSLGTLEIGLTLNKSDYDSSLSQAKRHLSEFKRIARDLEVAVSVNDSRLFDLNKHLDQKVAHLKQVNREYRRSPITPVVDTTYLDVAAVKVEKLKSSLSSLSGGSISGTIEVRHTYESKRIGSALDKSANILSDIRSQLKDVKELIKENTKKTKNPGLLGSIVGGTVGRVAGGFFSGVGEIGGNRLGEGLFDALGVDLNRVGRQTGQVARAKLIRLQRFSDYVARNLFNLPEGTETYFKLLAKNVNLFYDSLTDPQLYRDIENAIVELGRIKNFDIESKQTQQQIQNALQTVTNRFRDVMQENLARITGAALKIISQPLRINKRIKLGDSSRIAIENLEIYRSLYRDQARREQVEQRQGIINVVGGVQPAQSEPGKPYLQSTYDLAAQFREIYSQAFIEAIPPYFSNDIRELEDSPMRMIREQVFSFIENNMEMLSKIFDESELRAAMAGLSELHPIDRILQVNTRGYDQDAIRLATQALAQSLEFPDKSVAIAGGSGGGYVVEEAISILNEIARIYPEYAEAIAKIKGVGIGTPMAGLTSTLPDPDKAIAQYVSLIGDLDQVGAAFFGGGLLQKKLQSKDPQERAEAEAVLGQNPVTMMTGALHPSEYQKVVKNWGKDHKIGMMVASEEFRRTLQDLLELSRKMASGVVKEIEKYEKRIEGLRSQLEKLPQSALGQRSNIIAQIDRAEAGKVDLIMQAYPELGSGVKQARENLASRQARVERLSAARERLPQESLMLPRLEARIAEARAEVRQAQAELREATKDFNAAYRSDTGALDVGQVNRAARGGIVARIFDELVGNIAATLSTALEIPNVSGRIFSYLDPNLADPETAERTANAPPETVNLPTGESGSLLRFWMFSRKNIIRGMEDELKDAFDALEAEIAKLAEMGFADILQQAPYEEIFERPGATNPDATEFGQQFSTPQPDNPNVMPRFREIFHRIGVGEIKDASLAKLMQAMERLPADTEFQQQARKVLQALIDLKKRDVELYQDFLRQVATLKREIEGGSEEAKKQLISLLETSPFSRLRELRETGQQFYQEKGGKLKPTGLAKTVQGQADISVVPQFLSKIYKELLNFETGLRQNAEPLKAIVAEARNLNSIIREVDLLANAGNVSRIDQDVLADIFSIDFIRQYNQFVERAKERLNRIEAINQELAGLQLEREVRLGAGRDVAEIDQRIEQLERQRQEMRTPPEYANLQPIPLENLQLLGRGYTGQVVADPRNRIAIKRATTDFAAEKVGTPAEIEAMRAMGQYAPQPVAAIPELRTLVMEFVRGRSVEELIRNLSPDSPDFQRLIQQMGALMRVLHQRGFAHNDMSIANVLIGEQGNPVAIDFANAEALSEDERRRNEQIQRDIETAIARSTDNPNVSPQMREAIRQQFNLGYQQGEELLQTGQAANQQAVANLDEQRLAGIREEFSQYINNLVELYNLQAEKQLATLLRQPERMKDVNIKEYFKNLNRSMGDAFARYSEAIASGNIHQAMELAEEAIQRITSARMIAENAKRIFENAGREFTGGRSAQATIGLASEYLNYLQYGGGRRKEQRDRPGLLNDPNVGENLLRNSELARSAWQQTTEEIAKRLIKLGVSADKIGKYIQGRIAEASPGTTYQIRKHWQRTSDFVIARMQKLSEKAKKVSKEIEDSLNKNLGKVVEQKFDVSPGKNLGETLKATAQSPKAQAFGTNLATAAVGAGTAMLASNYGIVAQMGSEIAATLITKYLLSYLRFAKAYDPQILEQKVADLAETIGQETIDAITKAARVDPLSNRAAQDEIRKELTGDIAGFLGSSTVGNAISQLAPLLTAAIGVDVSGILSTLGGATAGSYAAGLFTKISDYFASLEEAAEKSELLWARSTQEIADRIKELRDKAEQEGKKIQRAISEGSPGVTANIRKYWERTYRYIAERLNGLSEVAEKNGARIEENLTPRPRKEWERIAERLGWDRSALVPVRNYNLERYMGEIGQRVSLIENRSRMMIGYSEALGGGAYEQKGLLPPADRDFAAIRRLLFQISLKIDRLSDRILALPAAYSEPDPRRSLPPSYDPWDEVVEEVKRIAIAAEQPPAEQKQLPPLEIRGSLSPAYDPWDEVVEAIRSISKKFREWTFAEIQKALPTTLPTIEGEIVSPYSAYNPRKGIYPNDPLLPPADYTIPSPWDNYEEEFRNFEISIADWARIRLDRAIARIKGQAIDDPWEAVVEEVRQDIDEIRSTLDFAALIEEANRNVEAAITDQAERIKRNQTIILPGGVEPVELQEDPWEQIQVELKELQRKIKQAVEDFEIQPLLPAGRPVRGMLPPDYDPWVDAEIDLNNAIEAEIRAIKEWEQAIESAGESAREFNQLLLEPARLPLEDPWITDNSEAIKAEMQAIAEWQQSLIEAEQTAEETPDFWIQDLNQDLDEAVRKLQGFERKLLEINKLIAPGASDREVARKYQELQRELIPGAKIQMLTGGGGSGKPPITIDVTASPADDGDPQKQAKAVRDANDQIEKDYLETTRNVKNAWEALTRYIRKQIGYLPDEPLGFMTDINRQADAFVRGLPDLPEFLGEIGNAIEMLSQKSPVFGNFVRTLKELAIASLSLYGIYGMGDLLAEVGRRAVRSALDIEQFKLALRFADINDPIQKLDELRQTANELGTSFLEAARDYRRLALATQGTDFAAQLDERIRQLQEVYAAFQVNPEQQRRGTTALEQVLSKGFVQAEEVRQQLAEAIPGAYQIAARGFGIESERLDRIMREGGIRGDEFVSRFLSQASLEASAILPGVTSSSQAEINRFLNTLEEMEIAVGEKVLGITKLILPLARLFINPLADNISLLVSGFLASLISSLGYLILKTRLGMVALKTFGLQSIATAYQTQGLVGVLRAGTGAVVGFGKALGSIIKASVPIFGLMLALEGVVKVLTAGNEELKDLAKATEENLRNVEQYLGIRQQEKGFWERFREGFFKNPLFRITVYTGFEEGDVLKIGLTDVPNRLKDVENIKNALKDIDNLLSTSKARFDDEETIKQAKEDLEEIERRQNRLRIDIAIAMQAGDTEEVVKLREELAKLTRERDLLIKKAFGGIGELQASKQILERVERITQASDLLSPREKQTVLDKVTEALPEAERQINNYKEAVEATQLQISQLSVELARVTGQIADYREATNRIAIESRIELIENRGSFSDLEYNRRESEIDLGAAKTELEALRRESEGIINRLYDELGEFDRQYLQEFLGIEEFSQVTNEALNVARAKIEDIEEKGDGVTQPVKRAIDALEEYLSIQSRIPDAQLRTAEATAKLNQALKEQAKLAERLRFRGALIDSAQGQAAVERQRYQSSLDIARFRQQNPSFDDQGLLDLQSELSIAAEEVRVFSDSLNAFNSGFENISAETKQEFLDIVGLSGKSFAEALDLITSELLSTVRANLTEEQQVALRQNPQLEALFDILDSYVGVRDNLRQANLSQTQNISQITRQINQSLRGIANRYRDFIQGLNDRIASLIAEVKKIRLEADLQALQNDLQRQIAPGSRGIARQFVDIISSGIEEVKNISLGAIDREEQQRQFLSEMRSTLRELAEIQKEYSDLMQAASLQTEEIKSIGDTADDILAVLKTGFSGLIGVTKEGQKLQASSMVADLLSQLPRLSGNLKGDRAEASNQLSEAEYQAMLQRELQRRQQIARLESERASKQESLAALRSSRQQRYNSGASLTDLAYGVAYDPSRFEGSIPGITPPGNDERNRQLDEQQYKQEIRLVEAIEKLNEQIASFQQQSLAEGLSIGSREAIAPGLESPPEQMQPSGFATLDGLSDRFAPTLNPNLSGAAGDAIAQLEQLGQEKLSAQSKLVAEQIEALGYSIRDQVETAFRNLDDDIRQRSRSIADLNRQIEDIELSILPDSYQKRLQTELRSVERQFISIRQSVADARKELKEFLESGDSDFDSFVDRLIRQNNIDPNAAEELRSALSNLQLNFEDRVAAYEDLVELLRSDEELTELERQLREATIQRIEEEERRSTRDYVGGILGDLYQSHADAIEYDDYERARAEGRAREIEQRLNFAQQMERFTDLEPTLQQLGYDTDRIRANLIEINELELEQIREEAELFRQQFEGIKFDSFKNGLRELLSQGIFSFDSLRDAALSFLQTLVDGFANVAAQAGTNWLFETFFSGIFSGLGGIGAGGGGEDVIDFLFTPINLRHGGDLSKIAADIPNYKKGTLEEALSIGYGAMRAMEKEGIGALVAVLNDREIVLNEHQSRKMRSLMESGKFHTMMAQVPNYKLGTSDKILDNMLGNIDSLSKSSQFARTPIDPANNISKYGSGGKIEHHYHDHSVMKIEVSDKNTLGETADQMIYKQEQRKRRVTSKYGLAKRGS